MRAVAMMPGLRVERLALGQHLVHQPRMRVPGLALDRAGDLREYARMLFRRIVGDQPDGPPHHGQKPLARRRSFLGGGHGR